MFLKVVYCGLVKMCLQVGRINNILIDKTYDILEAYFCSFKRAISPFSILYKKDALKVDFIKQ